MMETPLFRLSEGKDKAGIARGLITGMAVYLAVVVRYAGYFLLLVLLITQIQQLVAMRKQGTAWHNRYRAVVSFLLPYVTFLTLYFVVGQLIPYPSTQAADVRRINLSTFIYNIGFYAYLLVRFICSFVPFGQQLPRLVQVIIALPLILFMLWGIIKMWRREMHLILYVLGTMLTLLLLPYNQGFRYIFNILPVVLLFVAHGGKKLAEKEGKPQKAGWRVLLAALCMGLLFNTSFYAARNMSQGRIRQEGPYSISAQQAYQYIRDNLSDEERVLFCKARGLTFNTQRLSYWRVHTALAQGDKSYYLLASTDDEIAKDVNADYKAVADSGYTMELVFSNASMMLYRLLPPSAQST